MSVLQFHSFSLNNLHYHLLKDENIKKAKKNNKKCTHANSFINILIVFLFFLVKMGKFSETKLNINFFLILFRK